MSNTPPSEHSDNPFLVDQSRHEYWDDRASERKNDRPTLKDFFIHDTHSSCLFFYISIVSTLLLGKGLQIRTIAGFSLPFPTNEDLKAGALFASLLLSFLTVHEFGHYFAALYHQVRVGLPYFIPLPVGIGTLGAVIKIRQRIQRTQSLFDIGAAGPIAGFVVSLIILIIGFITLPGPVF